MEETPSTDLMKAGVNSEENENNDLTFTISRDIS